MTRRPNTLRIIGGQWRGRKLEFPAIDAIRPTPDRVRETVFNWLQDRIVGARCLDLFAGSGALGFEALSRGAKEVVFVDREPKIARYLRDTLQRLQAVNAAVHIADAQQWLTGPAQAFDIVFLDPPFAAEILTPVLKNLAANRWVVADAAVYIECAATGGMPPLPAAWTLLKSKTAGQVGYHLARPASSE